MVKLTYQKVKEMFESKKCKLVTTEEEFIENKMGSRSYYKIISKCGHENLSNYDTCKSQNCGVMCKNCVSLENVNKDLDCSSLIEYKGFCEIREVIQEMVQVKKLVEGTLADFIVKPIGVDEDSWMPIQLKVTTCPNELHSNNYHFKAVNKNYDNMHVLCLCLSDKRLWLIPGTKINHISSLHIGYTRSIYSIYEVKLEDLSAKISELYDDENVQKSNYRVLNKPISEAQQREQEYRTFREETFPFINFEYPELEGTVYDFKVGDLKIQEKVATKQIKNKIHKKDSYVVKLFDKKSYKEGDNALYWIQIPDKHFFYLFPESILIDNGFISSGNNEVKTHLLALYPLTLGSEHISEKWVNHYLFEYEKIERATLEQILTTGEVPKQEVTNHATYQEMCRDRMAKARGVSFICTDLNGVSKKYVSISQASRDLDIPVSTLSKALRDKKDINDYRFTVI